MSITQNEQFLPEDRGSEQYKRQAWLRYLSRHIDLALFSILLGIIFYLFNLSLPKNNAALVMTVLFLWILPEAIFLSFVGTTFGKWFLKIRLRNKEGKKIGFLSALKRSFFVWLNGMGIGFPIVSLFTNISAYSDLTKRGITSWDKKGNFIVTHGEVGYARVAVGLIIFILPIFLFLTAYSANHH